jgi:hypothetical protein
MLNNLPRSRPENPREIARCSMSAVQRLSAGKSP